MQLKKLDIPIVEPDTRVEACCGGPDGPPANEHERPGYLICRFVEGFHDTSAGSVPRVANRLNWFDRLGTFRARLGLRRNDYRVAPGLYCLGRPDQQSPVLVTASYKLSFDALRSSLQGTDAWLLVLDTRGINVWCAAAHKTFATSELLYRLKLCGLEQVVHHRRLIVPQLGAAGISAHRVKRDSGFTVVWGPLRAIDIPDFIKQGQKADSGMRRLSFTMTERLVLVPVELTLAIKPILISLAVVFLLAGFGPWGYSWAMVERRWLSAAAPLLTGLVSGAVLVPMFLPWLPFRSFYLKGMVAGLVTAAVLVGVSGTLSIPLRLSQVLICLAISSYAAMNFTGATPFASPSGVEKEMRRGLPVQSLMLLAAGVLWLLAPFVGWVL